MWTSLALSDKEAAFATIHRCADGLWARVGPSQLFGMTLKLSTHVDRVVHEEPGLKEGVCGLIG
jgi:hypothetical protein